MRGRAARSASLAWTTASPFESSCTEDVRSLSSCSRIEPDAIDLDAVRELAQGVVQLLACAAAQGIANRFPCLELIGHLILLLFAPPG